MLTWREHHPASPYAKGAQSEIEGIQNAMGRARKSRDSAEDYHKPEEGMEDMMKKEAEKKEAESSSEDDADDNKGEKKEAAIEDGNKVEVVDLVSESMADAIKEEHGLDEVDDTGFTLPK